MRKYIIVLVILILSGFLSFVLLNKNNEKITNYTNISEDELLMKSLGYYKEELNRTNSSVDNYCIFKMVDEDNNLIKDGEIEFDDGSSKEIILKTNEEGYAGISYLTKKDYGFIIKKIKGEEVKEEEEHLVNLNQEECNFTIKSTNDKIEITKNTLNKRKNLQSLESINITKSISYNIDESIFLKKDFLGEKLTIATSNELSIDGNAKYNYYVQISNAYILEMTVKLKNPLKTQKIVNLEGKEQSTFKDEAGFSFMASEEEFKESEAELIITFKMNNKVYKIKKEITLGQNFEQAKQLQVKNNYKSTVKLEVNYLNINTGEEIFATSKDLESGYIWTTNNLDVGSYALNVYVGNKIKGSIYFIIENNKETYLIVN